MSAEWVECEYGCGTKVCLNPSDARARQAIWNHLCLEKVARLSRLQKQSEMSVPQPKTNCPLCGAPARKVFGRRRFLVGDKVVMNWKFFDKPPVPDIRGEVVGFAKKGLLRIQVQSGEIEEWNEAYWELADSPATNGKE